MKAARAHATLVFLLSHTLACILITTMQSMLSSCVEQAIVRLGVCCRSYKDI